MAFEIVPAGSFARAEVLPKGTCTLRRSGQLTVHAEDLAEAGVTDRVMLLADGGTLRIALRGARDGEQGAFSCTVIKRKSGRDSGLRSVNAGKALRRLGLDATTAAGRYALVAKDDLLIVNLVGDGKEVKDGKGPKRSKGGKA